MKIFGYRLLGTILKNLSDNCFKAADQEDRGERVTACGMSSEELDDLCEQMQWMLDGKMTKYEGAKMLHCSTSTFDRLVRDGALPEGQQKAGSHEKYWNKADIVSYKRRNK